jgi:formate dehydrogenase iron-sulfur subunit
MTEHMAILTDVTRCIGCDQCVAACKETNETGTDQMWPWQRRIDSLSATRWTTVLRRPGGRYVRQQCRHCLEPACVSACPVGALTQTPEGAVVYNTTICMGCRYCMMACPYGIPRYEWSDSVPYVRKCVLCHDKIQSGELTEPACTAACPTEATIYGPRQALLEEAHRRIRDNPDRYIPKVWGEHEVGGSSVLYLSDIDLGFLGLKPDMGDEPLPPLTVPAMTAVPPVFATVGVVMGGIYWIIERRMRLERERQALAATEADQSSEDDPS